MARRKRKKGGKRRMVCPKTRAGKKVRSSGGRCWYKTYVKKVSAKKSRKRGRRRRKR